MFIQFPVGSQYLLCAFFINIPTFLYGMIEAKLGNELGFLRASITHRCHLLFWRETKKYMNNI
jgi:hypothetical protein